MTAYERNKALIDEFLASGRTANVPTKGVVQIKVKGKVIRLTNSAGFYTSEGEYYNSKKRLELWEPGTKEYPFGTYAVHKIKGPLRVRKKQKVNGVFDLVPTTYGTFYYKNRPEEYRVEVMARTKYTRRDGRVQTYEEQNAYVSLPPHVTNALSVNHELSEQQKSAVIREQVMQYFASLPTDADGDAELDVYDEEDMTTTTN